MFVVVHLPNQLNFPWGDDGIQFLPFGGEGLLSAGLGKDKKGERRGF